MLEELELLAQRHFLRARCCERQAQEVAQPGHHPVGRLDVAVEQRGDRVQRVEEEVRLQLDLERLQLGPGELGLQLQGRRSRSR